MTTTTELPPKAILAEVEVMPAEVKSASTELAAPADKALVLFEPFRKPFEAAAALLLEEESATDSASARALRLKMVKARTAITATKDDAKSDIKLSANIIDWYHNKGRDRLAAAESRLMDIEKAEERRIAEELRQRTEKRTAELRPFIDPALPMPAVGGMTEDQFQATLADAKLLHDMKLETARKAEEERLEREAEATRERVRIAEENERLRKEAAEREAQLKAEREAAAAKQRELEEQARKQRDEAEAKAKAERDKLEAAARAEREKAEAAAKAERETREKIEAEAAALRREAEEKRKAEEKRQADELAAKAAAAKAPDREKLIAFAATVRALSPGEMATAAGNQVLGEIADQVAKFATWIEKKAATL